MAPERQIRELLAELALRFPEDLRPGQMADIERIAFHYEQIQGKGQSVVDLGGGIGLFPIVCAAQGMQTWLVDDFADPVNETHSIESMGIHHGFTIGVIETEVAYWGGHFEADSVDIITCFESMEHWHGSPRSVLLQAMRVLRPGGFLVISVPNAVNLRKRLAVISGHSTWGRFEDWYYPIKFRGHVREFTVAELVRAVSEVGFVAGGVKGRNWQRPKPFSSAMWSPIDSLLRLFPTLCSTLYITATKPTHQ